MLVKGATAIYGDAVFGFTRNTVMPCIGYEISTIPYNVRHTVVTSRSIKIPTVYTISYDIVHILGEALETAKWDVAYMSRTVMCQKAMSLVGPSMHYSVYGYTENPLINQ